MSEQFKAFWLGVFILAGIAAASWLLLFLKPSVGDGKLTLRIRFSNINQISVGTRVTFAGKPIGEVTSIKEVTDPRMSPPDEFGDIYIYELTLKVDSGVRIFSYDEIIFSSSGLLGEKTIAIIPKVPPVGGPPSQEVTGEILYALSIDKLEQTLNQLKLVAEKFEETMEGVDEFFETNTEDFNTALKSLTYAADEVGMFSAHANNINFLDRTAKAVDTFNSTLVKANDLITETKNNKLVEKLAASFDSIRQVGEQINSGQGTIGRMVTNDSLYCELKDLICKFDMLVRDINNYGLLFQFSRKWQRVRAVRLRQSRQCFSPCHPCTSIDQEIDPFSTLFEDAATPLP